MKRLVIVAAIFACAFFGFQFQASASESCPDRVMWGKTELKQGQIGKVTILKNVQSYTLSSSIKPAKLLLKDAEYRVYSYKNGYYGLGGGLFVKKDSSVLYQTPSKAKLSLLNCQDASVFSVSGITIGTPKADVERLLGREKDRQLNEYSSLWYVYHQNYKNFILISYDKSNKVEGFYTNSGQLKSGSGITIGTSKADTRDSLGSPISYIVKGYTRYNLEQTAEKDYFSIKGNIATVFYDVHNAGKVTAVQMLKQEMEERKTGFFGPPTVSLQLAFERTMFDLTNSIRVRNGFGAVTRDMLADRSARKHSQDMAEHNFFAHNNLRGETPFTRMTKEGVRYSAAGENIAMGYYSSIFAHEALLNSLGHRKNILDPKWRNLGVGVAFTDKEGLPYYSQNYFTPK